MPSTLIWGASGGIGSALTNCLKREGWIVFAAGRQENRLPANADLLLEFDAADDYSFRQAAYQVALRTNAVDLIVYAAGVMHASPVDQIEPGMLQAVVDANLMGVQRAAAVSLPLLREGGMFMAIGAYIDRITLPKFGVYAAAKAALEPMMVVLRRENRRLRFCLVRLGAVDTPFWQNVPFSIPKGAASAESVAEAMLAHFHAGGEGDLNL
ncbi:SDR family NAD(P)-dependent oxidoreductase [Anaerolineae bacterium CFX9]|nr:SDR family NAD(P)-dependent oxidoreductase [Anaerolineae bacterium CFX9]